MITVLPYLAATCAAALAAAALVFGRRSAARAAFAAGMALLALDQLLAAPGAAAAVAADLREWQQWRLLVVAFVPGTWFWFSCRYARDAQSDRANRNPTRAALAAAILGPGLFAGVFFGDLIAASGPGAAATGFSGRLGWPGGVVAGLVLIGSIGILLNLERTFRASVGTLRWRLKFMLLGVGVLFLARVYTASQALLFQAVDPALASVDAVALLVATPLLVRAFLRPGHFDTPVYPSRSALQHSLTVLLGGIYLLVVAAFARLAAHVGGDAAFPLKAFVILVALVGLAAGLQSDRIRLRLRQFVSRHFQRPFHDYRSVWQQFTAATASRVEPAELSRSLVTLMAETFSALSVTLWLIDERTESVTLAGSTSRREADGSAPQAVEARAIVAHFEKSPHAIEIETAGGDWAAALRRWHPAEFVNGGHRAAAPLLGRGRVLGVIVIGDRVSGLPFSCEDLGMLDCIAGHAAASLLTVRLSEALLQARQLEAFQAMAACFVHDLKNAASTLTLMLQNLPVHFHDPAFRADALRGIGNAAGHLNRLIGRLTAVRHELALQTSACDLNDVVTKAIAELEQAPRARVEKEVQPLPLIPLDREQLQKVIVNLLLNACEAVPRDGRIRVATGEKDGWVVLTVDDNGCGMSPDFLTHSLFRPFQTTKKDGLGIGMFQSKMIVEAHGGRIAVASTPGKGTTFRVFLRAPLPAG